MNANILLIAGVHCVFPQHHIQISELTLLSLRLLLLFFQSKSKITHLSPFNLVTQFFVLISLLLLIFPQVRMASAIAHLSSIFRVPKTTGKKIDARDQSATENQKHKQKQKQHKKNDKRIEE